MVIKTMLNMAEELLILLIDAEEGDFINVAQRTLSYALAASVLIELELEHRIDTDDTSVTLLDDSPLDDDILDPVLASLAREMRGRTGSSTPEFWVRRIAEGAEDLREKVIARLIASGILESDEAGPLFLSRLMMRSRRYTASAHEAEQEIRLRVMSALFSDDLPSPRDVFIISLAHACGAFRLMLSADEYREVREKIELYSRLERLGRAMAHVIATLTVADSQALRRTLIKEGGDWPKAPGPPLLGNTLQMSGDTSVYLTEQYNSLGPLFELRVLGRKILILAGPEANLFLLRHGKNYFRSRDQWLSFNSELGAAHALVSLDGADHSQLRAAMRAGYSRGLMERSAQDADAILSREIDGLPLDRGVPVFRTFQRVISEQIGVISGGMSSGEYMEDIRTYFEALMMVHLLRLHPRIMLQRPKVRRARRRSNEFFEKVLAAHDPESRRGCPRRDLVDDLLEVHQASPTLMPESDMWFSFMGPFIVGMHTVAATASYMLYSLLQHPEVMARVQAEADELFASGSPASEGVGNMTGGLHAMLETLRLYPPVPGVARAVCNSFDFAGYRIPAGSNVIFATSVTNRLPQFFPDPERFDIDRFTPENRRQHIRPGTFGPFGLGSHSCLGQGFAQVLIPLTVAGLLHRRKIALDPPGYRMNSKYIPLPKPDGGFKIRLQPRG